MIWWLAFEKKPFQFWREIWIQVIVILLQLYQWSSHCKQGWMFQSLPAQYEFGYQICQQIIHSSILILIKRRAQGAFWLPIYILQFLMIMNTKLSSNPNSKCMDIIKSISLALMQVKGAYFIAEFNYVTRRLWQSPEIVTPYLKASTVGPLESNMRVFHN